MTTFQDKTGRRYSIELGPEAIEDLRDDHQIDLSTPIGVARAAADPAKAAKVLAAGGVTPEPETADVAAGFTGRFARTLAHGFAAEACRVLPVGKGRSAVREQVLRNDLDVAKLAGVAPADE